MSYYPPKTCTTLCQRSLRVKRNMCKELLSAPKLRQFTSYISRCVCVGVSFYTWSLARKRNPSEQAIRPKIPQASSVTTTAQKQLVKENVSSFSISSILKSARWVLKGVITMVDPLRNLASLHSWQIFQSLKFKLQVCFCKMHPIGILRCNCNHRIFIRKNCYSSGESIQLGV